MLCIYYLNLHLEKVGNSNFSKGFLIGGSLCFWLTVYEQEETTQKINNWVYGKKIKNCS